MANSIIKIIEHDGTSMFVTGVSNKSITCLRHLSRIMTLRECSKLANCEGMIRHVIQSCTESNLVKDLVYVTNVEAFWESMHNSPVVRFDEQSEDAKRFGIKPWHHCFCFGTKIFCAVWDTRHIDFCIDVDSITDWTSAEIVKTDNGKRLRFNSDQNPELAKFIYMIQKQLNSTISKENYELIRK